MKLIMNWVLAATLLCGAGVFTACSSDDDNSDKTNNISEKIIGKWMVDELDGPAYARGRHHLHRHIPDDEGEITRQSVQGQSRGRR